MSDEIPPDPGSPRARFGAEMRRLREAAQLSQSAVGRRLGCTQTQISRLESATRTPSKSDAERLDALFGTDGSTYFVDLREYIVARHGGPVWFMSWTKEVEPFAITMRSWDPLLVPGLLQIESYARHVLSYSARIAPDELEERVQARMQRREVLDKEDSPLFTALIDEGVLHRRVGSIEVMREQFDHLLEMAKRPTISIQVVDPQCIAGMSGAFMIAELPGGQPDTIHADSSVQGQVTTEYEFVVSVKSQYEAIRRWAYPEHMSLKMIEEARQGWT
ncbi:helix-turn-helix domain-containing protein [Streptosporangium amethystogenes]|uniref:helix-turn-helix domain-containing protein n=1 Tax=Streptosporangium amethystogenes TaxID=2002 RepID=UPI00056BA66D|nr:helix-turn-helix transcriptional regulator [Streptosporangium amethystogenes]